MFKISCYLVIAYPVGIEQIKFFELIAGNSYHDIQ